VDDDDGEGEKVDMVESRIGAVVSPLGRRAPSSGIGKRHATSEGRGWKEGGKRVRLITQWPLWELPWELPRQHPSNSQQTSTCSVRYGSGLAGESAQQPSSKRHQ
jgi:hypothetical protein